MSSEDQSHMGAKKVLETKESRSYNGGILKMNTIKIIKRPICKSQAVNMWGYQSSTPVTQARSSPSRAEPLAIRSSHPSSVQHICSLNLHSSFLILTLLSLPSFQPPIPRIFHNKNRIPIFPLLSRFAISASCRISS